jgi:hypothetical protein
MKATAAPMSYAALRWVMGVTAILLDGRCGDDDGVYSVYALGGGVRSSGGEWVCFDQFFGPAIQFVMDCEMVRVAMTRPR